MALSDDYEDEVLADAPVLYWKLNETSGTTADNAQGSTAFDGTYSGDYLQNAAKVPGLPFTRLNYDGEGSLDGQVSVGTGLEPIGDRSDWPTTDLTLEAWYNSWTGTEAGSLMCYSSYGALDSVFRLDTLADAEAYETYFSFAVNGNITTFDKRLGTPGADLYADKYVALTWTSSTGEVKLYVNGILVETKTVGMGETISVFGALTAFSVGQGFNAVGDALDPTKCFRGTVGQVAVYNTVLSAERILAHYQTLAEGTTFKYATIDPISTEGDIVPPVVDNWTASPVTTTGSVSVDITEASFSYLNQEVWAYLPALDRTELVYDGSDFSEPYTGSEVSDDDPVRTLTLVRAGGWPGDFEITVVARDQFNKTAATQAYSLSDGTGITINGWTSSPVASSDDVEVDVTTTLIDDLTTTIYVTHNGTNETVYQGGSFLSPFTGGSVSTDGNTKTFTIHRTNGWLGSFTVHVSATNGVSTATGSQAYTLTDSGGYPPLMNPFTLE